MKPYIQDKINDANFILVKLGMPEGDTNTFTGLVLLSLTYTPPHQSLVYALNECLTVSQIMTFVSKHYDIKYAPNTRESFRKRAINQMLEHEIIVRNGGDEHISVNSPNTFYNLARNNRYLLKELALQYGK